MIYSAHIVISNISIVGESESKKGGFTSKGIYEQPVRHVRQVLPQTPFGNKVLRHNLGLSINQPQPVILHRKIFTYPKPFANQQNIGNIGTQIASSVQNLVNYHLQSTFQRNLAAQEVFSKFSNNQPQIQPCITCNPQFLGPNHGMNHHLNIEQPQVSLTSYSQVQVTCSGDPQSCGNLPSIPHPEFGTVQTSQQKFESFLPQGQTMLPVQEYENSQQEQKTFDIVHLDDSDDKEKLIETPESNIDIRFGN